MSIELILCIAFMLVSMPASKSVSAHYLAFALANIALAGYEIADSSILAMMFAVLAATDAALVVAGGRKVLLVSAAASAALCFESMLNMDWLLSHSTYISAAVNAVIAASLVKGYWIWTHGK